MTWEIGLLLGIVALAVVLFSMERISPDVIGLGLVVLLSVTGLLPKERAFEGFGSDTVITILGLLILTAALLRTGVMDIVTTTGASVTGDRNSNNAPNAIVRTGSDAKAISTSDNECSSSRGV